MSSNYHARRSQFHIKLSRLAHPTCKLGPCSPKNLQSAFHHHTHLSRGVTKSYRMHAHGLSKSSTAKMKDTIRNAWHTNTLNKYGSGVEHFVASATVKTYRHIFAYQQVNISCAHSPPPPPDIALETQSVATYRPFELGTSSTMLLTWAAYNSSTQSKVLEI